LAKNERAAPHTPTDDAPIFFFHVRLHLLTVVALVQLNGSVVYGQIVK
jgi:hypothetical protein